LRPTTRLGWRSWSSEWGGVDRFRAGELDPFGTDRVLFQYSRATKELWKFCNTLDVVVTAATIAAGAPVDWWEPEHRDSDEPTDGRRSTDQGRPIVACEHRD